MATITERIVERMGGVTKTRLNDLVSRAYEAGYDDGNDEPPSGELNSYNYQKAGGGVRQSPIDHDKMLTAVWQAYNKTLLGKRTAHIKRDHIIGRGVKPTADNDNLQAVLDGFWKTNKLSRRASEYANQLFLFGEQCLPAFVQTSSGAVQTGYIDPAMIERVICDPDNVLDFVAVVIKAEEPSTDSWRTEAKQRVYRIIQPDRDTVERTADGETRNSANHPGRLVTAEQANLAKWEAVMLKHYELDKYSGSCFFERVNAVSNQARGQSDLTQAADYIDQADTTLSQLGMREQQSGYFAWVVKLLGSDNNLLRKRANELRKQGPPPSGSMRVENEAETWRMETPDIKQRGFIETYDRQETAVLGGLGYPRHWYGSGDGTNRATAVAQGSPTWRSLAHDQGIVKDLLMNMCEFARDQAVIAQTISEKDAETAIELNMPEMAQKQTVEAVQAFVQLVSGIIAALADKLISKETAVMATNKMLAELDIEVDPDETLPEGGDENENAAEAYKAYADSLDELDEVLAWRVNGSDTSAS